MNIEWNAEQYKNDFSFVPEYGAGILDLLTAPRGAAVVDLGCGNGALTERLAARGYRVIGIDDSAAQIQAARAAHPGLSFRQGNALDFSLEEKADAVFSNAVFHWIDEEKQPAMLQNIAAQLKRGGELVAEFGGHGCGESVHAALEEAFASRGLRYRRPFYFPTIGQYAPLLEQCGFTVRYATLFDRPTPQKGADGLKNWIDMFLKTPFAGMEESQKAQIIAEAENRLRQKLCRGGIWYVDYVRLRLRAEKT